MEWTPEWVSSWSDWRTAFEAAQSPDERIGLLKIGFDIPHLYDWCPQGEHVSYYLGLADGHAHARLLRHPNDRTLEPHQGNRNTPFGSTDSLSDLRLMVARTAFDVLCTRFFKNKTDMVCSDSQPSWVDLIRKRSVLRDVLRFFRAAEGEFGGRWEVVNLPRVDWYDGNKHNAKVANDFMNDFIRWVWDTHEREEANFRRYLDRIKPYLAHVMCCTGRTWKLLRDETYADKACMRVLEKVALRCELRYDHRLMHHSERDQDRLAATVEEAAAFGSQSAQVLMLLRNREKEHARLKEIREAKERAAEAAEELEALTLRP